MANTHHPENKQPQGEGNNLGQISKGSTEQHLECLRQWLKDERADMESATRIDDREYHKGRCCGFVLAIELLEGRILEIDGN